MIVANPTPQMKKYVLILSLLGTLTLYAQEQVFTSRKGPKFLPGHLDMIITIKNDTLKYELFHHWYSRSYAQMRSLEIPLSDLHKTDSIAFKFVKNGIRLTDKKWGIAKKVKHKKHCNSLADMRKISYAYEITQRNNLKHYNLFKYTDLQLSETEFRAKVNENLLTKMRNE